MIRADGDLLFGILALQNGFIDQAALIAASHLWSRERSRPLAEILEHRGDLTPSRRALLEALIEEHVRQHNGDPAQSLAALSSAGGVGAALHSIDDVELNASLARIGAARRDSRSEGGPEALSGQWTALTRWPRQAETWQMGQ